MYHKVSEKYHIIEQIGKGGYGIVYLAKHKQLGNLQAIKELTPKTTAEKKRIQREVDILKQAQHPYIIKIDEVLQSDRATYICMEYAQEGSLENKLAKPLPIQESLNIVTDILKGIQAFHAQGIIHRDIKPANILFTHNNKAKIGDFGIAKSSLNISKQLTQTGTTLGTVGYMPPEQLLGKKDEINEQVDIYATGVILYEMLAGKHPFRGINQLETVNRTLKEQYIIKLPEKKIDQKLIAICHKAINHNKSKRYRYASEMLEDLTTYSTTHKNKEKTKTKNSLYSKQLQQLFLGLTTGLLLTGISSVFLFEKSSLQDKQEKLTKKYQELLANSYVKDKEIFRLKLKDIQRTIYNDLQQQSNFNITEDVLKGKELYTLGMIYYKGKGAAKNYKLAYQYFEQASNHNILDAYLKLGDMNLRGEGTKLSQQKAITYYEMVAKQNDPRGYHSLGTMHINERTIDAKGIEYFKKSAAMNYENSIENLVKILKTSDNKKDLVHYIKQGVKLNNAFCLGILGEIFITGQHNFKKNKKKGLEYIKKAILHGDIDSINFLLKYNKLNKNKHEKILQDLFKFMNKKENNSNTKQTVALGYMYSNGIGTEQDYLKAKELFEKAIRINNADAMFNLGTMYKEGYGVKKNYLKAKELYENAIKLDNTSAIINLGTMYYRGYGVKHNYLKAKKLFEKAIKLNSASAMFNLGIMYEEGHGVKQNYLKAKELYEKAIKLGNASAMYNLGLMYKEGHGVQQNYLKAKDLYEKAIKLGNTKALVSLGYIYSNGHGVEQSYLKAKQLFEKAIKTDGSLTAIYNLGVMYEKGYGVKQNYMKAKQLFEKATKLGHIDAMNNLAFMYQEGKGVQKDYTKAIKLYKNAIELGSAYAMTNLGVMYRNGHGVPKNYTKAIKLYENAIKLGRTDAVVNLGTMYYKGYGVKQNYIKAKQLFENAVTLGNARAMTNLGVMHYHGHGVKQNYPKAKEYWKEAATQGNKDAINYLKILK